MTEIEFPFRRAIPDDAAQLAQFVNVAGEGLPLYLWEKMAESGQSAWDVGCERARRNEGGFSYRNAILRMEGAKLVSCLIGYPLNDEPPGADLKGLPPMFVPLQALEDQVAGTWYINVVATLKGYRGHGYGSGLLNLAERIAISLRKRGLSLIVADSNVSARALYQRSGFREIDSRPMVKEEWKHPGQKWILMAKDL
ncbi:MAG TPA: GNAT family N-acetyltransferase [Burkholderiales bacterium]|nr:GNAT family N-acetyltransferase [Burkholderiales bacterium]